MQELSKEYQFKTIESDFECLYDIIDSLMTFDKSIFPETYYDRTTMEYCIEMANYVELCYHNSKLIGIVGCFKNNPYNDIDNELCYIYTFGVLEAYRNKGIGTRLLAGVINNAKSLKKQGLVTLEVYKKSTDTNLFANNCVIEYYKKHGFVIRPEFECEAQYFMTLEIG